MQQLNEATIYADRAESAYDAVLAAIHDGRHDLALTHAQDATKYAARAAGIAEALGAAASNATDLADNAVAAAESAGNAADRAYEADMKAVSALAAVAKPSPNPQET